MKGFICQFVLVKHQSGLKFIVKTKPKDTYKVLHLMLNSKMPRGIKFYIRRWFFSTKAMAEWIKSGVLDSVDQIGMEMHTGRVHVKPESHVRVLRDLIGYFQGRRQRGICI